jgi:hypothetical protein
VCDLGFDQWIRALAPLDVTPSIPPAW